MVASQDYEKAGTRWQFLFYGDSAVEGLRGTYLGNSWTLFGKGPTFWKMYFHSYVSAPLGIAGTISSSLAPLVPLLVLCGCHRFFSAVFCVEAPMHIPSVGGV
jgi:hypothetical protein